MKPETIEQNIITARKKGYTDAQIKTFLQSKGQDPSIVDRTVTPGFVSGVKSAFAKRVDTASDAQLKDQSIASKAIQTVGQGAGFVGDIALEAVKTVTPAPVQETVKSGVEAVASTETAQNLAEKYNAFKTAHPEAAANLEATDLITSILPVGKGISTGVEATGKALSKGTEFLGGVMKTGAEGIKEATTAGLAPASIMQRVARIPKSKQANFEKLAGESVGDYLVKRGIFGDVDGITTQLYKNFSTTKNTADEALAQLPGLYRPAGVRSALKELLAREQRISSPGVPSKDLSRVAELAKKAEGEGLTMSEINEAKRIYERNVKVDYIKSQKTEDVARANTIDSSIRDWQRAKAEELGLKNLKEINKETQLAKQLLDDLGREYAGSAGNNAISLTDWILLAGGDPTAVGGFLVKKVASSKGIMSKIAEKLSGGAKKKLPEADFAPVISGYLDFLKSTGD